MFFSYSTFFTVFGQVRPKITDIPTILGRFCNLPDNPHALNGTSLITLQPDSKNNNDMGEDKIIVVANQKGGVGKSTVCMTLANYLTLELKFRVGAIIDTDPQQSVGKRRKSDLEMSGGTGSYPAYEVTEFSLSNYPQIPDLIGELRKTDMFYIFDTPGNMKHQGIVSLLAFADFIIVPFSYDALVLASTVQFLIFWNNLRINFEKSNGQTLNGRIIFVPVMIDNRIGTAAERALWENIRTEYAKFGSIAPQIGYNADMKRSDTMRLTPRQKAAVQDTYDHIVKNIYSPKQDTTNTDNHGYEDTED